MWYRARGCQATRIRYRASCHQCEAKIARPLIAHSPSTHYPLELQRITHATPASFYAHVVDRDLESEIATFLVGDGPQGQSVDIALGGGLCFFLPNSTSVSCRTDDRDLIDKAQKAGYTVLRGVKSFREWREDDSGASNDGPVIGLFADDVSRAV